MNVDDVLNLLFSFDSGPLEPFIGMSFHDVEDLNFQTQCAPSTKSSTTNT